MTSWDFMENIATVYTDTATPGIFWLLIWILPMISMWNRQNGILIVSILYCFSGAFVATVLPAFWGGALFWMMVLGGAGILYRIFIPEQ
jgi:hypothetical protein